MKRWASWILTVALGLTAAVCLLFHPGAALPVYAPEVGRPTLILDAGHGGEDGGAVSLNGTPESGINLSIVRRLDQLLGLYGQTPVLLRQEDVSLHDARANTLREKKTSDLHNRAARVEEIEQGVLLSVHQNNFTDSRYHGAQVFYASTQGSEDWAVFTQELLRAALDPENSRQAKAIPDTVYLMNHISCPAILVECGFLSNPQEEAKLCSREYQLQLAAVLAGAWLQYENNFGPEGGADA